MSTIHATLGDKCREQLGDLPKNLFWSNSHLPQTTAADRDTKCGELGEPSMKYKVKRARFAPKKKKKNETARLRVFVWRLPTVLILIALHLPLRRNWPWFPPGPSEPKAMSNKKIGITDPARSRHNICKRYVVCYSISTIEVKCSTQLSSQQLQTCICIASFLQKNQILSLP